MSRWETQKTLGKWTIIVLCLGKVFDTFPKSTMSIVVGIGKLAPKLEYE